MSDLIDAFTSMAAARDGQEIAEAYYKGDVPEFFENARLRAMFGTSGRHFRMNYARVVVQSRLTRLEISGVSSPDDTATQVLDEIWTANAMDQESHEVHEAGLEYGEAYACVMAPEDGGTPDVFFNSPKSVRAFYSTENPREIKYVAKVWQEGDLTRANLYYPGDRIERYVSISKLGSRVQDSDFVPFVEDDEAWPTPDEGQIRWFHFRTQRQYGRPEHFDAYGPQNAINKLFATQMSSIDFVALPQRFALEDPAYSTAMSGADSAFGDVDDEEIDGSTPDLRADAGGVWWLKGVKELGQLASADQNAFLEPMREYRQAVMDLTGTPITAFQGTGGQMPSGESRRAAEIPLVKRVDDLQRIFGGTWKQLYSYALELMGVDAAVLLNWKPAESYEDADTWEAAASQIAVGVPQRQSLLERGYTDSQLDLWGIPDFPGASAQ